MNRVGGTELLLVEIFLPFGRVIVQPDRWLRSVPDIDMVGQREIAEAQFPADAAKRVGQFVLGRDLTDMGDERINLVEHYCLAARRSSASASTGTLAASIVSTPGLGTVARANGLEHVETLTGFKWISRAPGLVFGFEEALGYLVDPGKVRDKDGISAALAALGILMELRTRGVSFEEHRREFVARYGWFGSDQISIRVDDLAEITSAMARVRANIPAAIGGVPVVRWDDLKDGSGDLPASDVVRFWLDGGGRVILRPSGTEPKLKIYLDVAIDDGEPEGRRDRGEELLDRLRDGIDPLLGTR